ERLRFLLGSASADFARVPPGLAHWPRLLGAALGRVQDFAPCPVLALIPLGLLVRLPGSIEARRRLAALVPLLAALSFTITFTLAARRSEHRFLMPQVILLSVPAGIALDYLWSFQPGSLRLCARALVLLLAGMALRQALASDIALMDDPRYRIEAILEARVRAGDLIETYGVNTYQPRFPPRARVVRVDDRRPLASRNPLPGVVEILARYDGLGERRPDWVVAPRAWTNRWLIAADGLRSPLEELLAQDSVARQYFATLQAGALPGYIRVATASCAAGFWPRPRIHNSTCQEVDLLQRVASDGP
ncbi:MAG TPA: hypothetical protein VMK12_05420, partial [Anaeromyxobacteraceae bacterium]|nr:hypothetical protein [Anaeromyxobacteraceae bacterium]